MNNQQIFNAMRETCRRLATQEDRNGEVVISFCMDKTNTDDCEGNCRIELCPLLQEIEKPKFKATDLVEGKIYESRWSGTCKYIGVDSFMGELSYKFESITEGRVKYCKTDVIGDFLKPI